jgi:hypothetical protein
MPAVALRAIVTEIFDQARRAAAAMRHPETYIHDGPTYTLKRLAVPASSES